MRSQSFDFQHCYDLLSVMKAKRKDQDDKLVPTTSGPWKKVRKSPAVTDREELGLPPRPKIKRKAVSYLRFSTPGQADGDSKTRQQDATDRYCLQENLELIETFHDLGVTASTGAHRKRRFGDFLEQVRLRKIKKGTVFLVESFDRLSREDVTVALNQFLDLINKDGLEIHVIQAGRPPSVYKEGSVDSHALMYAIIEMGRAYGESERKSGLISSAWHAQRLRGVPVGKTGGRPMGRHPSWLNWDAGRWIVIPERVAVIKQIFDLCLKEKVGRYEIAVRLDREKVLHWGSKAGWTASGVKRVLSNPALTGRLDPQRSNHPDSQAVENYYPRIISDEDYLEVQRVLTARRSGGGRTRQVHPESLLTGIAFAKGARIHRGYSTQPSGKHQINYAYYHDKKNRYLAKGSDLDHLVLSAVGKMVDSDLSVTEAEVKRRKLLAGIDELRLLHQEAERKVHRLVDALAGGPDGKDFEIPELRGALISARTDRDDYMQRIIGLESEVQHLPTDTVDTHSALVSLIARAEALDPDARAQIRSLLSRLIKRIDVVKSKWPEWQSRSVGGLDGSVPEWAIALLGKSWEIFSKGGELRPSMLAIELRNGVRIGVISSDHTVMLVRENQQTSSSSGPRRKSTPST
ncbi:MAG: recombinase family protein [Verrucomicrobiaceae bacterium]|nr:MAG: recombinase family protein [Verrucomicrobiaceae bacterium]